jgi:hypothetical protein
MVTSEKYTYDIFGKIYLLRLLPLFQPEEIPLPSSVASSETKTLHRLPPLLAGKIILSSLLYIFRKVILFHHVHVLMMNMNVHYLFQPGKILLYSYVAT